MAQLNILQCGATSTNLGMPDCIHNPDLIIGAIPIPKGTVFSATDLVDFQATLQALFIHDTDASRAFRIGRFLELDDQSEERQQKTWGYGKKSTTRDATYDWVFYYTDGAMCMHKSLKRFQRRFSDYDYLFVDQSKNIIGTSGVDANGVVGLKGVTLSEFYVENWKPANGSDPVMYKCNFKLADATELNENYAFVAVSWDVFSLDVVKDVDSMPVGSSIIVDADGDINVGFYQGCGGQNMVTLYGATMANASRFAVTNNETGAAIAFAVASGGSGDSSYVAFNLDDTDAAYPSAGGYIRISGASISSLHSALGDYVKIQPLILEVA